MPNLPDNGAFCKMPQINQCGLPPPPPPFSSCIITKIPIMKILSASQPPSAHFPFPPFCPPAHCLARSLWRKFIKMKLRLQLTGFIKIHLPLTDTVLLSVCSGRQKGPFESFSNFYQHYVMDSYECAVSQKVHLLIYFCTWERYSRRHVLKKHVHTVWCYSLYR